MKIFSSNFFDDISTYFGNFSFQTHLNPIELRCTSKTSLSPFPTYFRRIKFSNLYRHPQLPTFTRKKVPFHNMDKGKRPMTAAQLEADERATKSRTTSVRRSLAPFYQEQRTNYHPLYQGSTTSSATTPFVTAPTFVNNVVQNHGPIQNRNSLYGGLPTSSSRTSFVASPTIVPNVVGNQGPIQNRNSLYGGVPTSSSRTPFVPSPTIVPNVVGNQQLQNQNSLYVGPPPSSFTNPFVASPSFVGNVFRNQTSLPSRLNQPPLVLQPAIAKNVDGNQAPPASPPNQHRHGVIASPGIRREWENQSIRMVNGISYQLMVSQVALWMKARSIESKQEGMGLS